MASSGEENLQLNSDFTYGQYAGQQQTFGPTPIPGSVAITTINGISGPTIAFDGGLSGFMFSPAGTTITLASPLTTKGDLYTRSSTAGTRLPVGTNGQVLSANSAQATGLQWVDGPPKSHVDVVAPTGSDDNSQGYSINSLWRDTVGSRTYICTDATTALAVWVIIV